ncbi:MAG: hypothetical protein ACKVOU_11335 [Cytophagales bacterium]
MEYNEVYCLGICVNGSFYSQLPFILNYLVFDETCFKAFEGTSKPEPLKLQFKGKWSR